MTTTTLPSHPSAAATTPAAGEAPAVAPAEEAAGVPVEAPEGAVERRGSAYPPTVAELLPRARALADRLGGLPSRNALMRELRIGAAKAAAVLAWLTEPNTATPTSSGPASSSTSSGRSGGRGQPDKSSPAVRGQRLASPTSGSTTSGDVQGGGAAGVAGVEARPDTARMRVWPVVVLALPAFVAIWSGWVGLGGLTGFGVVHPLPGIWDRLAINTAITLPIGMETYAAFALRAWLHPAAPARARRFARTSAMVALGLGAAGQIAYHLMSAAGMTAAPWQITTVVACLPVAVLGMGAALAHLLHHATPAASGPTQAPVSGIGG